MEKIIFFFFLKLMIYEIKNVLIQIPYLNYFLFFMFPKTFYGHYIQEAIKQGKINKDEFLEKLTDEELKFLSIK